MSHSNFVDYVKIFCRSGKGGAGSRHFRRAKFEPMGGPDGGDGGRGGNIILRGNPQLWTLMHLKYHRHVFAEHGESGKGAGRSGKAGDDVFIDVPLGTIAKDADTDAILFEITEAGQTITMVQGGRGGLGNTNFKTATHQAPEYAQPGEPFIEGYYILELKVLADVGLVGFPNAGKSTLLSKVSEAKPKIADYAFTTLTPNLGIVPYRDYKSFVMADIPGIIEGASEGKGLGLRFLRHIERNSLLLFLIPADSNNVAEEYRILVNELEMYNPELLDKERVLAISKSELIDSEMRELISAEMPNVPHIFISSFTGEGLVQMKDLLWNSLNKPL